MFIYLLERLFVQSVAKEEKESIMTDAAACTNDGFP